MKPPMYCTTMPPPALAGTDAVYQELDVLRNRFGGTVISLYPFKKPSRFVPNEAMGWHNRSAIRKAARDAGFVHVFSATLRPLPALSGIDVPLFYTVTAAVGAKPSLRWFARHRVTIIVNNERDGQRLKNAGYTRARLIRPGIDLSHFTYTQPPPTEPFRLLIGSAPWTRAQFRTKGIDALISAAQQDRQLHLVFLWRNLWLDDLTARIQDAGIEGQTTVHNQRMDVNALLTDCHAAAVLAEHERLVKAWPHSAIEALAAGRPALLSACISMSEYVQQKHAGVQIQQLEPDAILTAISIAKKQLRDSERIREQTLNHFSLDASLKAHETLYAGELNSQH